MKKSASENVIVRSSNRDGSGNDPCKTRWEWRDFCRAIRLKRELFKLQAFTASQLASFNLSSFSPRILLLSFLATRFSLPYLPHSSPPSVPYLLRHFLPEHSPFFTVSVSFEAFHTVYKVEALNWKLRLCPRYCGFFLFFFFFFHFFVSSSLPGLRLTVLRFVAFFPVTFASFFFVFHPWRPRFSPVLRQITKTHVENVKTGCRYSWRWEPRFIEHTVSLR